MKSNQDHIVEAEQMTFYLLSVPLMAAEKNRYSDAMKQFKIELSKYERLLWDAMLESKWKMACIDAGLAITDPNNNVRRKLFTMLAIMEASPNYTSFFLSENHSLLYLLKLAGAGIRAVFRTVIGIVIIKNIHRKCS